MQALDLQEARRRIIAEAVPPRESEAVSTATAKGRVLAADVASPVDLPPFPSSAMDGYAYADAAAADKSLRVVGASLAGHPYPGALNAGECIRITTGAEVPRSADTVVIQENCERDGDNLTLTERPTAGANIRAQGHDVTTGALVARAGQRLNAFDIAWLAAVGVESVSVVVRPKVALFSTVDELKEPGAPLQAGEIYDANRLALKSLMANLPVALTDLGILPDDRDALEAALGQAATEHDLLLTSGGVSVGDADYVKEIIERLGHIGLWRLNLKPGKPLAFGRAGQALFLGLPGNPVSTIVTYLLIAQPLLLKLAGTEAEPPFSFKARLAAELRHNPGREEYQRGILSRGADGYQVSVSGDQSSNRLATFSGANCLIRIRKEDGHLAAGTNVEVIPLKELID
ncbi:MAG: gephyrin-like molybdotransferase Glp [Pseudomonadota bacterium]